MFPQSIAFLILQVGTGFFWTITYILIIRCGFKDKTYGMPVVALCANISWEFIFSFIYPHEGLQLIINILWFFLDTIIMLQYLLFGWKSFKKYISAKYFYPIFLIVLVLSFFIIITISIEFNDFQGKYSAFAQNFMMSILFVVLLFARGNTLGQSIYIGIFKMFGSLLAAIGFYLYFESYLINLFSIGTLFFDLLYIVLLHNMIYKTKSNSFIKYNIS